MKLQKWKDFQRMWLYLVGACDICWHYELSESLLTSPGGWWLGSSYSSASGAATDQPIGIGNKEDCKIHHTLRLLTGWNQIVLLQILYETDAGLMFGSCVRCQDLLHGLIGKGSSNKCSQHCFLHPVWLHFSLKSNLNHLSFSLVY